MTIDTVQHVSMAKLSFSAKFVPSFRLVDGIDTRKETFTLSLNQHLATSFTIHIVNNMLLMLYHLST